MILCHINSIVFFSMRLQLSLELYDEEQVILSITYPPFHNEFGHSSLTWYNCSLVHCHSPIRASGDLCTIVDWWKCTDVTHKHHLGEIEDGGADYDIHPEYGQFDWTFILRFNYRSFLTEFPMMIWASDNDIAMQNKTAAAGYWLVILMYHWLIWLLQDRPGQWIEKWIKPTFGTGVDDHEWSNTELFIINFLILLLCILLFSPNIFLHKSFLHYCFNYTLYCEPKQPVKHSRQHEDKIYNAHAHL